MIFNINEKYKELLRRLESVDEISTNEFGEPIDEDGNIIDDVEKYMESMRDSILSDIYTYEDDFVNKAESLGNYIKSTNYEIDALKKEIERLQKQKKERENRVERLKTFLKTSMEDMFMDKVQTTSCKILTRRSERVVFTDDFVKTAPEKYLRYKAPEIDKVKIKADLKKGIEIPGAYTEENISLIIK